MERTPNIIRQEIATLKGRLAELVPGRKAARRTEAAIEALQIELAAVEGEPMNEATETTTEATTSRRAELEAKIAAETARRNDLISRKSKAKADEKIQALRAELNEIPEVKAEFEAKRREYSRQRALDQLQAGVDSAKAEAEKFAEDVKVDPLHALSWASNVAKAAAYGAICARVLYLIDKPINHMGEPTGETFTLRQAMEAVRKEVSDDLIHNRFRSNSTSQFHNATEAAKAEAASDFVTSVWWDLEYL